ncbi:hypothetical protein B0T14DRAFT_161700 [Immersiella caudata]|uniref:T6SS Phospholipase effector Tle1-like catalytic domain-containing protein n=1 Tax=Immersiella caudata TaxID=314043 RepID=A0AA39WWR4_9PEZI|nr:hypothetical protein B0T14DRAFT_161700 [Immersiella caudata]
MPLFQSSSAQAVKKRLIVCCDGTWMNSDTGYTKPTFYNPVGKLQTPSNVTRLSRSLRRICTDGTIQIIEYHSGVGTGGTVADLVSGGAFGLGISENIRSAYSFICANYRDGDEVILIGFSRGAFTARSVAGMVDNIGLLTREGMEFFYPIYKDMQNWQTSDYEDPFPGVPFDIKPRGITAKAVYRQMLADRGLTRLYQGVNKDKLIKIRAVAVFDTVGSLGVPNVSLLSKLGLHQSTKEFRFFDTDISNRVEYAFQALALDEHRLPFSPTLWERAATNNKATDLRQVWFPGNHGNVGGGWQDAGVANMSLAWMMDQLASIGVEFDEKTISRIFTRLVRDYRDMANASKPEAPPPITSDDPIAGDEPEGESSAFCGLLQKVKPNILPKVKQWAISPIFEINDPVRPWSLGAILGSEGMMFKMIGYNLRTPGMYRKVDPETGSSTRVFLEDTNERLHSSVRTRLAMKGLGLNDTSVWKAPALKGNWRLRTTMEHFPDPIPPTQTTWEPSEAVGAAAIAADGDETAKAPDDSNAEARKMVDTIADRQRPLSVAKNRPYRWIWEYCGPEKEAPPQRIMVEEPLGPFERQLLRLSGGDPNVYAFAEKMAIDEL